MQDGRNGTYTVCFKVEQVGLVSISALINNQPLGLPTTIRAVAAELHSLYLMSQMPLETRAGEKKVIFGVCSLFAACAIEVLQCLDKKHGIPRYE